MPSDAPPEPKRQTARPTRMFLLAAFALVTANVGLAHQPATLFGLDVDQSQGLLTAQLGGATLRTLYRPSTAHSFRLELNLSVANSYMSADLGNVITHPLAAERDH
jgi:hypothetical protein